MRPCSIEVINFNIKSESRGYTRDIWILVDVTSRLAGPMRTRWIHKNIIDTMLSVLDWKLRTRFGNCATLGNRTKIGYSYRI